MKHWSRIEWVLLGSFAIAVAAALAGVRGVTDTLLILLAAANVHAVIGHHWGVKLARRWALSVLGILALAVAIGTKTGQPFGSFYFTDRLGPILLGVVPLAVPFLWYTVISCCLLLARAFLPWASARNEALAVSAGVVAFDFLTEPYWLWTRGAWFWSTNRVPIQNYIAWGVITYLLVRLVSPSSGMRWEREWRPALIVGGLLAITLRRFY